MPFSLGERGPVGVWPPSNRSACLGQARLLATHARPAPRTPGPRRSRRPRASSSGARPSKRQVVQAQALLIRRADAGTQARAPPPAPPRARARGPAGAGRDAERFLRARPCRRCPREREAERRVSVIWVQLERKSENDARLFRRSLEITCAEMSREARGTRARRARDARTSEGRRPSRCLRWHRASHTARSLRTALGRGGAASPSPAGVDADRHEPKTLTLNACGLDAGCCRERARGDARRAKQHVPWRKRPWTPW